MGLRTAVEPHSNKETEENSEIAFGDVMAQKSWNAYPYSVAVCGCEFNLFACYVAYAVPSVPTLKGPGAEFRPATTRLI